MTPETPESVLDFWIGGAADDPAVAREKSRLWFGKSFTTDAAIADRFLPTLVALAGGLAYEWALSSPHGRLAAIIGLDQFPRNIFRGMRAAFEFDALALDLCTHGVLLTEDMSLKPVERQFFYMPLEHSERTSDQALCIKVFNGALNAAAEPFKPIIQDALDYAERHQTVIEKFGRFPHRNEIFARSNSAEEFAWLETEGGF